jgi:hypothetical protein
MADKLTLLEPQSPAPLATRDEPASLVATIAALAANPAVNVDTLQKLMDMHGSMVLRQAKGDFNAALSTAQEAMRPVSADASNPQTKSKYASYAALDRAIRPIYTKHGFGLSFDTGEALKPEDVRVLCYVSHGHGFERTYHVDMPADGKGAKGGDVMTRTHATGAALSYGMRYLLKMIFNIAVGEDDRDGNDPAEHRDAPAGFERWADDMEATADDGWTVLEKAWKEAKPDFRAYATLYCKSWWENLKAKAGRVSK